MRVGLAHGETFAGHIKSDRDQFKNQDTIFNAIVVTGPGSQPPHRHPVVPISERNCVETGHICSIRTYLLLDFGNHPREAPEFHAIGVWGRRRTLLGPRSSSVPVGPNASIVRTPSLFMRSSVALSSLSVATTLDNGVRVDVLWLMSGPSAAVARFCKLVGLLKLRNLLELLGFLNWLDWRDWRHCWRLSRRGLF